MNSNTFLSFVFLAVISMSVTAHANAVPAPAGGSSAGSIADKVGKIGKNIGKIIRKGGGIGTAIQVGVAVVDIITSEEMTQANTCDGVFIYNWASAPRYASKGKDKQSSDFIDFANSFSEEMIENQKRLNSGKFAEPNFRVKNYQNSNRVDLQYDSYYSGRVVTSSVTVARSCVDSDVVNGSDTDTKPKPTSDVVGGSEVGAGSGAVPDVGKGTDVGTGVGVGADTRPIPDSQADSIPDSKAGAVPDVGKGTDVGAGTQAGTQAGAKADSKADTDTALPPETAPISRDEEWELEFPVFCDWAKPVCDFLDWFRGDVPKPKDPTSPNNIDMSDDGRFNRYVSFNRECPPDYHIKFSYMGRSFDISFSFLSFCQALESFAPFLVALTFLSTATMVVRSM